MSCLLRTQCGRFELADNDNLASINKGAQEILIRSRLPPLPKLAQTLLPELENDTELVLLLAADVMTCNTKIAVRWSHLSLPVQLEHVHLAMTPKQEQHTGGKEICQTRL